MFASHRTHYELLNTTDTSHLDFEGLVQELQTNPISLRRIELIRNICAIAANEYGLLFLDFADINELIDAVRSLDEDLSFS